ncbi:zinc-dependent alcohol dehydrogenase [Thermomonospora cellulosilytica]|uniref:Threonine dehydrogenase-like Zn-dependent dehydrogenase n=1 Tax=Thermomonospora cellulosilytica TaxID=1411118 RepID=A0A7W3MZX9_9ACTN|nr:zinc-binding alcohol dehydrogenase [Thermomonospora cellulosilytica]MBA9004983.1 threonine dehydrogenase-like Zn-dependent dehydrogenase [Thermomonospora cellulosilytica]
MAEVRTLHVIDVGKVVIADEEDRPVPDGGFRVETLYSGLSAGTELSYVKGTNPYLSSSWDPVLGLFRPDRAAAGYPVTRMGYMEVARVTDTRTGAVAPGQILAMAYGHRTAYTAHWADDRFVPLPDDLDPMLGIYVAHMGPICANGLLHAAADLCGTDVRTLGDGVRGRRVVVTGAGVVGLLTALFARRHGAAEVVVVDRTPERLDRAARLGLDVLDMDAADPALKVKTRWRHAHQDRGADVVFQCRGRPESLHLALRMLRPRGTVVDLAFYQDGADGLRLGEEFHHNALSIRCSQIGRVPRGLDHVWSRERLSAETIDLLRHHGDAIRGHLVTDVLPFDDAPAFVADLAARRRHTLQAVFDMAGDMAGDGAGDGAGPA